MRTMFMPARRSFYIISTEFVFGPMVQMIDVLRVTSASLCTCKLLIHSMRLSLADFTLDCCCYCICAGIR